MSTCKAWGCAKPVHARGFCAACYGADYRVRMKELKVEPKVRYAIKMQTRNGNTFLVHNERGMIEAFNTAHDAEGEGLSLLTCVGQPYVDFEIVEVIGKEDPL